MKQYHPPTMPEKAGWTEPEIRAAMALKRVSRKNIAEASGLTGAAISNAITGTRQGLSARKAVADALGVPVTVIWPDAEFIQRKVRVLNPVA